MAGAEEEAVWALEERLWLEGVSAYEELLDPACLMAFPGIGVLAAPAIIEALRGAPRWSSVEMSGREARRADGGIMVLAYAALGRRKGEQPYRCICTSTYRLAAPGRWTIIQHQQTLAGAPES